MTTVNTDALTEVLVAGPTLNPSIALSITGTLTALVVEGRADPAAPWQRFVDDADDFRNWTSGVTWTSPKDRAIVGAKDTTVTFRLVTPGFRDIRVLAAGTGDVTATALDAVLQGLTVGQSPNNTFLYGPDGSYALPLSSANLIGGFGDSLIALASVSGVLQYKRLSGLLSAIEHYSEGAVVFNTAMNFGVGGNTTADMLGRVNQVITAFINNGVRNVVMDGGVNDYPAGIMPGDVNTVGSTISNLNVLFKRFRDAGIRVFFFGIPPRANSYGTTDVSLQQRRAYAQVNAWLQLYPETHSGFHFWNPASAYVSMTASGNDAGDPIGGNLGDPRNAVPDPTAYTSDGLHHAILGGMASGRGMWLNCMAPYFSARSPRWLNPADVAHITQNPTGNALANGQLNGTGGALSGGATGSVATGWALAATAGGALVVGSKGSFVNKDGNTIPTQVVTLAPGASTFTLTQTIPAANLAAVGILPGDFVVAEGVMPGTGLVQCTRMELDVADGLGGGFIINGTGTAGQYFPSSTPGYFRTSPFRLSTAFPQVVFRMVGAVVGAAGAGVFTISQLSLRKYVP